MLRNTVLTVAAFAAGALAVFAYSGAYTPSYALTAAAPPAGAPMTFADLAERLLPTVVNISSTQKMDNADAQTQDAPEFPEGSPFEDFFNDYMKRHQEQMQSVPPTSLGSGFIIDREKGYIVTNNHVIKDAEEIRVTLHDNSIVNASVVGKDDKTDIALLQADLKGHDIAAAAFGDSDALRVGDWVMAIGNPFGLGGTVTAGIVSARKRDINAGPYDDFIQTDASINRGNSGGPMFNLKGQVIGINTAIYSPSGGSVGIGFAIPSSMAKSVIDQLVKYGKTRRGWLGVRIQTVTDEIAQALGMDKTRGALVASITETGPAAKAGVKAGDIVLKFDGKDVPDMRALPKIVADTEIGRSVPMVAWRNGKEMTVNVAVGELEAAEAKGLIEKQSPAEPEAPETGQSIGELGVHLLPLSPSIRGQFGIAADTNGLVVMDIDNGSDAARKGLSEGDVIVEMNQTPVKTIDDVRKVIAEMRAAKKSSVLMLVNHQGDIQFIAVKLAERDTDKSGATPDAKTKLAPPAIPAEPSPAP
ncbi:MAG: DegQ family serine endoprotease [Rhodospirillales bacterium]|nr:DegQ family serine endoprotease [Alphaproteobacteria bacterium]MCB9986950.1 DegQ family serine endoprotease [Rhodospirillales bacterium]USO08275.1 MAG: DegQ family serine endoprotease [Rhodospirillales bacterium]